MPAGSVTGATKEATKDTEATAKVLAAKDAEAAAEVVAAKDAETAPARAATKEQERRVREEEQATDEEGQHSS